MRIIKLAIFSLTIICCLSIKSQPVAINTNLPSETNYDYGQLFKNLSSKNDSIALNAYFLLSNGKPDEVIPRISKYELEDFDYKLNYSLPQFKNSFLHQLVLFTTYCKENNITYIPDDTLIALYNKCINCKDYKEISETENEMFNKLSLANIATLEYWSVLYEMEGMQLGGSAGRILDIFYSKHWEEILNNRENLRTYLRKSYHFNNLGIIGSCNSYLEKFRNCKNEIDPLLKDLLLNEKDTCIKKEIIMLKCGIYDKYYDKHIIDRDSIIKFVKLDEFLNNPSFYSYTFLEAVQLDSTESDILKVIDKIINTSDKNELLMYLSLLETHSNAHMTPALLKLLDNNKIVRQSEIGWHDMKMDIHSIKFEVSIADIAVTLLEEIHNIVFPISGSDFQIKPFISYSYDNFARFKDKYKSADKWLEKWSMDSLNYLNWGAKFFNSKLDSLERKSKVTIKEINELLNSKFNNQSDIDTILSNINKVRPKESAYNIYLNNEDRPQGRLNTKFLHYFENIYLNPDDVKHILYRFKDDNFIYKIDFIFKVSKSFTNEQKGEIFSEFYWDTEFWKLYQEKLLDLQKIEEMVTCLEAFSKSKKAFKMDVEKSNALIKMLQTYGKPIEKRIEISKKSEKGEYDFLDRRILETSNYNDLGAILKNYGNFRNEKWISDGFLREDMGILIDNDSTEVIRDLLRNYEKLDEKSFYAHYLDTNGMDYNKEDGTPDYNKIYKILKYDFTPGLFDFFRNQHGLSIIRILEIQFNTTLGYDYKFNDIVRYDLKPRRRKWMDFLKEKGLITVNEDNLSSFNEAR